MNTQEEPSYLAFARANVRDGYASSHTIVRALLDRIEWNPSPARPAVVHVAHDPEAHARSFNEGYEAAVTQGLADDPTLADDWFQGKLREARAQALEDAARAIEIDNRNSRAKMARHFRNAHAAKLREMAADERGDA